MRSRSTRCHSQADVLGMYGVLCVCSGVVDTEDDTRQALLVTPLWFIALGRAGCLLVKNAWRSNAAFITLKAPAGAFVFIYS